MPSGLSQHVAAGKWLLQAQSAQLLPCTTMGDLVALEYGRQPFQLVVADLCPPDVIGFAAPNGERAFVYNVELDIDAETSQEDTCRDVG